MDQLSGAPHLPFLYFFLPITYFVFWRLQSKNQRYIWLSITGYVFYSFWNYKFCALMAFSTLVSYLAGLGFLKWQDARRCRWCLVAPITVDLLLLGFFKYFNFTLNSVQSGVEWFGGHWTAPHLEIVLPVGISFYTFHTITYIVDSYRGTITPTRNFWEFSCYVSLFSQLVAGPIVRFRQIENDLENIDHAERSAKLNLAWSFFVIGMIKKVLVADTIAAQINPALAHYQSLSSLDAWLCMLGYTYQLYFDFSGYSDMAVGLGYLFGIHIPQNFNSPYKATDISDFWRRWHISLSTCLRDYLYIPMGGNRVVTWKIYRNLMITMLLGGLWHGANWTFVFWGGYHGVLLAMYRAWGKHWDLLPSWVRRMATFFLVVIGWVFFRSDNFSMALVLLHKMFLWNSLPSLSYTWAMAAAVAIAGGLAHMRPNSWELRHEWRPVTVAGLAALFILCMVVIYGGNPSPFLYFQF